MNAVAMGVSRLSGRSLLLIAAVAFGSVYSGCTTTNGPGTGTGTSGSTSDAGAGGSGGSIINVPSDGGASGVTYLTSAQLMMLCNTLITTCGNTNITEADCVANYSTFRVSQACLSQLNSAPSCADLENSASVLQTTCFPACSPASTNQCATDKTAVVVCDQNGQQEVLDCVRLCNANNTNPGSGCDGTCTTQAGQVTCCCVSR